ncbi:APC family permease [Novosphingobium fluoreni]|nr:APC family permease [Novosphingobium fluoreni]
MSDNLGMQSSISTSEPAEAGHLTRTIGLFDLVMISAGSALGFSIFSVLSPAAAIGGSGILVTTVLAAMPMAVFGLVYAFLASANPRSGASFEWPREYLHPFVGFFLSWLRIFGSVGQLTTVSLVLVQYASMVVPLPVKPAMFALFVIVFLVNLAGLKVAAKAQSILMIVLLGTLGIFVVTGIGAIRPDNIFPLAPAGLWPILLAAPIMINLFMGIESATEVGEEVVNAERNVPLGILLSLLVIGAVYLSVAVVALGLVGAKGLAASSAPLVTAAGRSIPSLALTLIVGAAIVSLAKSLNASFLIFSRAFYAMGRAGVMPPALARLSGEAAVPRVAITASFACLVAGLCLPSNLVFLFLASNIPTILKYLTVCLCGVKVSKWRPDVLAAARMRLSGTSVFALSLLGAATALGLFALGYETDWRPYALIGVWGGIGTLYWVYRSKLGAVA